MNNIVYKELKTWNLKIWHVGNNCIAINKAPRAIIYKPLIIIRSFQPIFEYDRSDTLLIDDIAYTIRNDLAKL